MAITFNPERVLTIRATLIDLMLDQSKVYALLLSNGMDKEIEHAREKAKLRFTQTLSEEEQQECTNYYDAIIDDIELFPQQLWNNCFASFYFYFEHAFVTMCNAVQTLKKVKIGVGDMKEHGIVQCRNYLTKVHDFDFDKVKQEWDKLFAYKDIRNQIVHNGGYCDPKKHKDLIKRIRSLGDITVNKHNYIVINKAFCFSVLDTMKSFIKTLFWYCEGDKGDIVIR